MDASGQFQIQNIAQRLFDQFFNLCLKNASVQITGFLISVFFAPAQFRNAVC